MATFIERCIRVGDYETDGGVIDPTSVRTALQLYERADTNMDSLAEVGTAVTYDSGSLTQAQEAELAEILATMPPTASNPTGAVNRAAWATRVAGVLEAGVRQWAGFTTGAAIRTKLGLA
jgi:hypothetical protein